MRTFEELFTKSCKTLEQCDPAIHVTDNAASMKATMKAQSWLGCAGHNLNLALAHGLKLEDKQQSTEDEEDLSTAYQENLMTEVIQLTYVCEGIVSHVKRSCIQAKLGTTLKKAVSIRWNSIPC